MTFRDKVAQLVVTASTDMAITSDTLDDWVSELGIGGVLMKPDSIVRQLDAVYYLQGRADVPLLFMSSSSNGYLDFLRDAPAFPPLTALQALADTSLVHDLAALTAAQGRAIGCGMLVTPLFNSHARRVSVSVLDSMIKYRVLAGYALTSDTSSRPTLTALALAGLPVLTAQVADSARVPAGFDGLLAVTLADTGETGMTVARAMASGADLFVTARPAAVIDAVANLLGADEVDRRVRKVLLAKAWCGLNDDPLPDPYAEKLIKSPATRLLARGLFEAAVTLVKNEGHVVPVVGLQGNKILIASFGRTFPALERQIELYAEASSIQISGDAEAAALLVNKANGYNTVVLAIGELDTNARHQLVQTMGELKAARLITIDFGERPVEDVIDSSDAFIQLYGYSRTEQELAGQLLFGGISAPGTLPYQVGQYAIGHGLHATPVIRLSYGIPEQVGMDATELARIDTIVQEAIANAATPGCQVFVAVKGKVVLNKSYGHHTYSGRNPVKWNDVYDIASVTKVAATTIAAIKLYDQGKLDLDDRLEEYFEDIRIDYTRIKADTVVIRDTINIYRVQDLAAQIAGRDTSRLNDSLLATRLTRISRVTPKLNIFKTRVRSLLLHKSGIAPSLPIIDFMRYRDSLHGLFNRFYCNEPDADFCVRVADNLYMRDDFLDTIWMLTKQMRIYGGEPVFQYSDANMVLAQRVIDSINGMSIDEFTRKTFYQPLALRFTGYLPLKHLERSRIVPTEVDRYWRNQTLQGDVHDPTAAILGGVSGNAGLFANANDLGVLFQMLLNGGTYGGKRCLSSGAVRLFTSKQPGSQRGLGFDMQGPKTICAQGASQGTFGHSGFTGTCVWADPANQVVFVFLSNRVHPSAKNWRLNAMKVRQRVHQVVYDALKAGFEPRLGSPEV
jgi:CubicO group peptidase (beta-lactamase class C family)/beta-glucosidase-like glycosyl hydrolase